MARSGDRIATPPPGGGGESKQTNKQTEGSELEFVIINVRFR